MKVGRNDPCPCGSGKKYKKCCLRKDEETRDAHRREASGYSSNDPEAGAHREKDPGDSASHASAASKRAPSPEEQAIQACWDDFKARDVAGKIALFEEIRDKPELMDGELAFEMLNVLHPVTVREGQRPGFDSLVAGLRTHRPEIYAEQSRYILGWLVSNALIERNPDKLAALAGEMAALAGADIDLWNPVESKLAYHGQLAVLHEAVHGAWPGVRDSENIVPWGIDEFRNRALDYEVFHQAGQTALPDLDEPALRARFEYYLEAELRESDTQHMAENFTHLAGKGKRDWTMDDFKLPPPQRAPVEYDEDSDDQPQPGVRALYLLTLDFLGELHRREGVAYTKGELGCHELRRFILRRRAGKLEYRESMLDATLRDMRRRSGHKQKPKRRFRPYAHVLVPDRERLDLFLGDMMRMFAQLHHRAAALVSIVPQWLEFLHSRQLINERIHSRANTDLAPLGESLGEIFEKMEDDPTLAYATEHWPRAD